MQYFSKLQVCVSILLNYLILVECDLPLGTLSFSADPERFQIGRNFIAKCEVQLLPYDRNWRYRVAFLVNNVPIGEYQVNGLTSIPSWNSVNFISGVNIYPEGISKYPFFYAMVQPLTSEAQGIYQCSVKADFIPTFPTVQSIYFSNRWNSNNSLVQFIPHGAAQYSTTSYSGGQISAGTHAFTAQCTISVSPNNYDYKVSFLMGNLVLGEFMITQEQGPITFTNIRWQTPNQIGGVNVFPKYESSAYPNFLALVQISTTNSYHLANMMQCSVTMEVPRGGSATFYSDRLLNSGSHNNDSLGVQFSGICALVILLFWFMSTF